MALKRRPVPGQPAPRDGQLAIGPTLTTAAKSALDPADDLAIAERDLALEAAIERLESPKRDVITLRRAGLSYKQIAQRTGLAVGSVGSVLTRTVEELKLTLSIHVD